MRSRSGFEPLVDARSRITLEVLDFGVINECSYRIKDARELWEIQARAGRNFRELDHFASGAGKSTVAHELVAGIATPASGTTRSGYPFRARDQAMIL